MLKYKATSPPNPMAAESAWDTVLSYLSDSKESRTVSGLFKSIDTDGDNGLSLEELSNGLVKMGLTMTPSEQRAFQKTLDIDGDGACSAFVDTCYAKNTHNSSFYLC